MATPETVAASSAGELGSEGALGSGGGGTISSINNSLYGSYRHLTSEMGLLPIPLHPGK